MKRYWFIFIALSLVLAGCGGAASSADYAMEESYAVGAAPAPMEMEYYAEPMMDDMAGNSVRSTSSGVEPAQQERLVIKNADLSITVDDPLESIDAISYLAESLGGHVVSSNTYQTYTNNGIRIPEGTITIRVPSEKLTETLDRIKEDAGSVPCGDAARGCRGTGGRRA